MSIDQQQVKNIAHLARLAIDDQDIEHYQNDINNILTLVEQLQQVDSSHDEPMAHPLGGLTQRLRSDEVTEQDLRPALQACAPDVAANLYVVPQVIEDSE